MTLQCFKLSCYNPCSLSKPVPIKLCKYKETQPRNTPAREGGGEEDYLLGTSPFTQGGGGVGAAEHGDGAAEQGTGYADQDQY
jgi:hypothetical protein